jgi:hypothetical protein
MYKKQKDLKAAQGSSHLQTAGGQRRIEIRQTKVRRKVLAPWLKICEQIHACQPRATE